MRLVDGSVCDGGAWYGSWEAMSRPPGWLRKAGRMWEALGCGAEVV